MTIARSLRFRLLAGAAVWVTLALAVAGFGLSELFRAHMQDQVEAELNRDLDQLSANLEADDKGAPTLRLPLSDPRFQRPLSGLYWQIDGPGGTMLRSRSLWDAVLPPPDGVQMRPHRHAELGPDKQFLYILERNVTLADRDLSFHLAVAIDLADAMAASADFNRVLVLSLAVLAAALIAASVVQVQVGLQPLAALQHELAEVRKGGRRRLTDDGPREVSPLVKDLNALLGRTEEGIARARLEAGNLAHALKTDLAILSNDAGALSGPEARAIRERLAAIRRTIDRHMARARAAATHGVPGSTAAVADSVGGIVRVLRRLSEEKALAIETEVPADLVFAGDRQDLDEILGNLIDNACKWAHHRVLVSGRAVAGRLTVVVEDDGPGLADDVRDAVTAPGVRLDESVPGTGLGLAVVKEFAGLYGGRLSLDRSPLGGLRAAVELPAV